MIVNSGRLHFLDGARGWAAVAVAYGHLELWLRPILESNGYGFVHDILYTSPFGLASELAVNLFFVISGFALTFPVLLSRNRYRTLRNMAAYRYFRLTIPILAACVVSYFLWQAGAFFNESAGYLSHSEWFSSFFRFTGGPPAVVRFSLFDIYFGHVNPRESWDPVLWTMSIELIGSFALFAFLAMVRSTRVRVIMALVAAGALGAGAQLGLGPYAGNYFGFPAGYLAAEFAVGSISTKGLAGAGPALLVGALTFGILSITPIVPQSVSAVIDPQCAMNLCAFLLFAGILLSPRAQAALSTPISRFMGEISFSLYLTHFLLLSTVGAGAYVLATEHNWAFIPKVVSVLAVATVACFAVAVCFDVVVEKFALSRVKRALLAVVERLWEPVAGPPTTAVPNK